MYKMSVKSTSELRIFNDARVTVISESKRVSQDGDSPGAGERFMN